METIGIIAEYNPFHLGHAHQLSYLADRWPQALRIVVMSGSFVQRGEPAFFSKFDRAYWALLGGADLVFELPALFALRSAEIFAAGAIRLLSQLHVDAFSFGSEVTNLDTLLEVAHSIDSDEVQARTKELIQTGLSYGAALRLALSESSPLTATALNQPNSLLGIEYLRALETYNLQLTPLLVPRQGSHYHDTSLANTYPSATALRTAFQNKEKNLPLANFFPEEVVPLINERLSSGHYLDIKRYYDLIHYQSRLQSASQLANYGEFTEGIENRWKKASQFSSWQQSRASIKTKRYTYARLDRMGAYTVLQWPKELLIKSHEQGPQYARLLGFTSAGRNWLRGHASNIPIIQKWGPFQRQATGFVSDMAQADTLATNIQSLCFSSPQSRVSDQDFHFTPHYLP